MHDRFFRTFSPCTYAAWDSGPTDSTPISKKNIAGSKMARRKSNQAFLGCVGKAYLIQIMSK